MVTSRNQVCPCGSGKKYKKCCMVRERVVHINKMQVARFYERKHLLTSMMLDFVWGKLTQREFESLKSDFEIRTGLHVSENMHTMMFQFYAVFMHRYKNNLRGIDWFVKEAGIRLDSDIRAYAKTWTNLKFRLIQAVDFTEEIIHFEDMITKETYSFANIKENVPDTICQHEGTIGLLEKNNQQYYFNGVRVFVQPNGLQRAKRKIESLMKETGMSYEEVMMEYTPEVLAEMLSEDNQTNYSEEDVPLLMELGLEHLPVYAMDFLTFYKEKTTGKKGNTVRKYRESLQDFNELLKRNGIIDLSNIDEKMWKRLLTKEYYDMFKTMTKTQITDLISTLKAYLQWKNRKGKATDWPGLADFLKEEERQLIHAVQFQNSFFPNLHAYMGTQTHEMLKLLRGEIVKDGEVIEGIFEILRRNKQSFRVVRLKSSQPSNENTKGSKNEEYTISGSDIEMEYAEEGLIFSGGITKGRINMWELLRIDEVYPRGAKPYLRKSE